MPLPAALWAGASWPDHPNCHAGPFEVGGALYAVALDKVNNHLEVGKSTDGGNTWAEVDAANHKPITATAGLKSAAACLDGTTLAIAYKADTNAGYMALFDTTTDTWGAASSIGTANVFADVTGKMPLALVARAPGDYVYVYIGQPDSIMGTGYDRVSIARYSSGAWQTFGVKVESPGTQIHQAFGGAVLGSSGRVHIYYRDRTNNVLRHNALLTTNGFGGASTIDASIAAGNYPLGLATSYVDGADTKIVVPYADATSGDLMAGRFTSADAPTFTSQAVSDLVVSTPEITASNPGAAAADGTTAHLFWPNDLDQDIYRSSDAGTGTWVTDAEHRDAVAVAGISIAKISGAIGLLYDNGGTVTFDTLSLGAASHALVGTSAGASTTTGVLGVARSLAGTSTGASSTTGAVGVTQALAGTSAGTSSTSAALTATKDLAATSAGGASTTGAVDVQHPLAGTSAGSSTTSGAAGVTRPLAGTSAGTSTTTGAFAGVELALTGTSTGTSTTTGALGVSQPVAGQSTGTASTSGALSATRGLSATSAGLSGTTGNLAVSVALTGTSAGTSTTSGAFEGSTALVGSSAGASATTGSLSIAVPLAGSSAGTSSTTGDLAVQRTLSGTSAGTSSTEGTFGAFVPLAATSTGTSTTSGSVSPLRGLTGTSTGASLTTGDLRRSVGLGGTTAGAGTTTGSVLTQYALGGVSTGSGDSTAVLSVKAFVASVGLLEGGYTIVLPEAIARAKAGVESGGTVENDESTGGTLAHIE